jgi:arylsulfatase A-like enzyme
MAERETKTATDTTLTRRQFLSAAAGSLGLAPARRKPNFVFVLLDDLGYGDFGCYGQKHIETPNVDRLASEGMRFTDVYAGGAVCAPSRSCLMTGLHTGHTPIRANAGTVPLLPGDVTLADVLKKAGYVTGGFGKWGLGDAGSTGVPSKHGFDEFFGYLHQRHAHSYYPEFLWDNEKKFVLPGNANGRRGQYSAELIAQRSFEFIEKHRSEPFFLYACYTLPHARYEIPDVGIYRDKPWPESYKVYAAMVTLADHYIGQIVALLRRFGLEKDTFVFVTSDNGAPSGAEKGFDFFRSNGKLRGEKGQLYEGGIRVPMIVWGPGRVPAGRTDSTPWAFWDVLPTLAELAGVKPPSRLDGISVAPLLLGEGLSKLAKREFLYWEAPVWVSKTGRFRPDVLPQAVRMGPWKALRNRPGSALALYHLETDISETRDVSSDHPEIVRRIEEYLETARTEPRPHDTGSLDFVS